MATRSVVVVACVLAMACTTCAFAAQASSANYILEKSVMASAGNASSSSNYSLGSTLGQPSAIGISFSTGYQLVAGFWEPVLDGDVNGDCVINLLDLLAVRNQIGLDPSSNPEARAADVNCDGKVNLLDLLYVRNRLNQRC